MEPTRTTSALQREIEASRARINQRRRSRTPMTPVRSVPTPQGTAEVRVDGPQASVPAPFTRADRLKNFVEQLRSSNQEAATQPASVPADPAPAETLTNHAHPPASLNQPAARADYASVQGQAARAVNHEIAEAISALDDSRQKYSELVAKKKLIPEHEVAVYAEEMATTKDDLVACISAAIATVLTDVDFESAAAPATPPAAMAEVTFAAPAPAPVQEGPVQESAIQAVPIQEVPAIESPTQEIPVLSHPRPSLESVPSHPSDKTSGVVNPAAEPVAQSPVAQPPVAQPPVSQPPVSQSPVSQPKDAKGDTLDYVDPDIFNVGAFIPADIAAWDVEKFLWPMIIDQFLDIGEQAISRLANFSIDILDGSDHRLAVTSVRPGSGATTIACSVARWAAKMRKRVLLVDANLKNPTLASSIGLAPNISWLNVVRESMDVSESIVRCKSTGVCVMPLGQTKDAENLPTMLLDHLGRLLSHVHHAFDLIVIDTGAAGQLPIGLSSSPQLIDAAMIVDSNVASAPFRSTKDALLKFGVTKFVAAQNSI